MLRYPAELQLCYGLLRSCRMRLLTLSTNVWVQDNFKSLKRGRLKLRNATVKLLSYVKGAWVQFPLDYHGVCQSLASRCNHGQIKNMRIPVERKETGKPDDFDNMTVDELRQYLRRD